MEKTYIYTDRQTDQGNFWGVSVFAVEIFTAFIIIIIMRQLL